MSNHSKFTENLIESRINKTDKYEYLLSEANGPPENKLLKPVKRNTPVVKKKNNKTKNN